MSITKFKKTLSFLLSAAIICTSFVGLSLPASAATSGTTGNCTWSLDGTTLKISGNGKMGDYFSYNSIPWGDSVETVIIENGVTSIGSSAFRGCTGLTSVIIGNSVTSIGSEAFSGCTSLTSIMVDKNNKVYISTGNCLIDKQKKELVLGCKNSVIPTDGSVTSIGGYAFRGCTGLTSITIPNSVSLIDYMAFYGCTGLTSITIPNSVSLIDYMAFYGCTGLTSITIPDSVTSIGEHAFRGCTGLTSITIPNSVTSIGGDAFYGCAGLTSITIPDSVTSIGSLAFSGCKGLTSITVDKNNKVYISNGNCLIDKQKKELISGCKNSVIPTDGSVTSIGSFAFSGCTGLTSLTIPDSVTLIGGYAFNYCGLTSITIPNSITSIGNSAFSGCTALTSITIPNSVTSIGNRAFSGCNIDTITFKGTEEQWYVKSYSTDGTFSGATVIFAPDYVSGDLDGDESVSDADAIYLLMHTFFPEDYPVNQPVDFDGDGSLSDADAIYLLMYTFFPEEYPIK